MKAKYGQSFADFLAWPEDEDFGGFEDGGQAADHNPDADGGYKQTLAVEQVEEEAATVIQTSFRGHRARVVVGEIRVNKAATTIQSSYRGHKAREAAAQKRLAMAASVDPAEVKRYTALLASYFAVHAPGKKTAADLEPIAERCASTGHAFLNGPLKRLYGQSINEFQSKAEANPKPEADPNEDFGGFGNDVEADVEPTVASETEILAQLKGYYGKHAPGTKTDTELQAIANRVFQTGTSRLNAPMLKKYGESFDEYVAGSKGAAGTSDSQKSVEHHMADLKAYYDRHAPGTKSDADLLPVARHCANDGTAWLDSPLKRKYGVSFSEFHKVTAKEFKPSARPMRRKGSAVYAIESGSDTYLEQLKGYYQKNAPGTKSTADLKPIAEHCVAKGGTSWLDKALTAKYGQSFSEFLAAQAAQPAGERAKFAEPASGDSAGGATVSSLPPDVAGYFTMIEGFYRKHAHGTKTFADIKAMAEHCVGDGNGIDWINLPLKEKYGESMTEFLATGGAAAVVEDVEEDIYGEATFADTDTSSDPTEAAATIAGGDDQPLYGNDEAIAQADAATTGDQPVYGNDEAIGQAAAADAGNQLHAGTLAKISAIKVSHPNNLAMKHFSVDYFNSLATDEEKSGLLQCVNSGVENADSGMGCYAMQPKDYDRFKPFFSKVLAEYHKVAEDAKHANDWSLDGVDGLPASGKLDLTALGLPELSMRVRTGRNLKEFPLPGAMTKEDRINLETKMCAAFEKLKAMPEFGGGYNSLTPGHADHIDDDAYSQLIVEHIMFKDMAADTYLAAAGIASDWPYGRGCYVSEDRGFVIWVGEEDHLRIMCMKKAAVLNDVFDRLKAALDVVNAIEGLEFAHSDDYGVVTSCPTNLGTGMRASVHIPIPNLTADGTDAKAKVICKPLGLSVRGTGGEHTPIGKDGTCDISPSARFCITEAEIITALYTGLKLLKEEEAKAGPAQPPDAGNQLHAGTLAKISAIKVSHPNNLAMKHFSVDYFNSLATDEEKSGLLQCVNSGVENADSGMGCYAMQPKDYDRFKPFFSKVLAEYHKVAEDAKHANDWSLDGVDGLPASGKLDLTALGLPELSMRVRTGRNLKEFPLPGAMTKEDRINLETKMCAAFEKLKAMPEFGGGYNSLTPGHADHIDDDAYSQLIVEHIMFKDMAADTYLAAAGIASDWPYGRGCYVSEDRGFVIWVGEEDHLRIMCMKKAAVLNDVFDRLKAALDVVNAIEGLEFAHSDDYGVVTSCPTNLGTGMRASVHIPIPNLTADGTDAKAKVICKPLGLSVRGTGGEHTPIGKDGTCDISPSARFCITEAEIITALYTGLKLLKEEEAKAGPAQPPTPVMSETEILGHLTGYYAKHAPGTKTDAELQGVAGRVYRGGSVRLNAPMKKKYGESFDEFVAGARATAASTAGGASADVPPAMASTASKSPVVVSEATLVAQLAAYYAQHAPGEKSEDALAKIAVRVMQTSTERLNGPMKKKYGQSFDEFVAIDMYTKKLTAFYAKHAPGTKSDKDIQPIAQRCAKTDATWLDAPMTKKYGQSFSDFAVDLEKNRTIVLQQLVAFYAKHGIQVGDKVDVLNKGTGTVRFVGAHHVSGEPRIGVELDNPTGKTNGTVKGHVYFTCKDLHGELCKPKKVTATVTKSEADLAPVADRCSRSGSAWMDAELKTKYGQSFTEFVASQ